MFTKLREKQENISVTDVIAQDKKVIRYRSILNILKSIHLLFMPKKKIEELQN